MFKVDWDLYNNETEPKQKNMLGASDDELLRKKIITAIAVYVKNHKNKVISLLNKHGIQQVGTEEELVSGITSQLFNGTKDFRDDLSMDLMKLNLLKNKQYENSLFGVDDAVAVAIISGAAALIGGGASVWTSKIRRQQEQERIKQELLAAIAAQKSGELQAGSKQQQIITIVIALIILVLIVIFYFSVIKPRKND